ncbi:DUF1294 domain-containing protein [Rummeliibacillus stabekisii]|nr:DUF1294 domain-containing protein [Rummeliibacillus stabekisii]
MKSTYYIIYFIVISFIGFVTMGVDKRKAIYKQWRIPEKRLWFIAMVGGAVGTWLGMMVFHHKSRRIHFVIGFTVLAIIDISIMLFLFN